jgi:DNA-binding LytR/AlgR family response regulator
VRQSLDAFMDEANNDILFRIHRSYAVNIQKVIRYSKKEIFMNDITLPVSRNIKDEFDHLMKSKM